jgi:hypothetical protein
MRFQVTRSFYVGDSLFEFGTEFRSDDQEQIKQLLEDGNIEEVAVGGTENVVPSTPDPVSTADQGATATPAPLEVASDLSSEATNPQAVAPVDTPVPVQTEQVVQAPVNPTQAEIEETLRALGLDSSSSNEVQIS